MIVSSHGVCACASVGACDAPAHIYAHARMRTHANASHVRARTRIGARLRRDAHPIHRQVSRLAKAEGRTLHVARCMFCTLHAVCSACCTLHGIRSADPGARWRERQRQRPRLRQELARGRRGAHQEAPDVQGVREHSRSAVPVSSCYAAAQVQGGGFRAISLACDSHTFATYVQQRAFDEAVASVKL